MSSNEQQWISCTGDAVKGDTIRWTEAVFGGSYRRPTHLGDRTNVGVIATDSYGEAKQQHTFTVEIISSDGHDPLVVGKKIRRKGRNVYRRGTERLVWSDESERDRTADEKHARGDEARRRRLSNSTSVLEMMRIKGAGLENASIDEIRAKLYPAIYGKDS